MDEQIKKHLIFTVVIFVVFFFSLEGLFRLIEVASPPRDVDYGLGFNAESRVFVEDPNNDLYRITNPKKLICFEDQKFTEIKSLGSLRIVALGGSSVQFLGLG
ncbi:MAG: hypothetical protein P9L88_04880 [Candidatus Tantalella remota]|nr:hypothetical protein [Candidatus Tantalella remota]